MNIDCFDKNVLSSTLSITFYTDNTKMKILEYTLQSADIFVISYLRLVQKQLFLLLGFCRDISRFHPLFQTKK